MRKILFAGLFVLSFVAQADDVKIDDAWTRATAPGQDSAMVQAVITSKQAATLVGVSCKCAKAAELHSMVHEDGMMKMRQVESLELPAGKAVDLGAAGYHLMLMGLKEQIKEGKKLQLTLTLRDADGKQKQVKFSAKARGLTDRAAQPMNHKATTADKGMGGMHDQGAHEHMHQH